MLQISHVQKGRCCSFALHDCYTEKTLSMILKYFLSTKYWKMPINGNIVPPIEEKNIGIGDKVT